MISFANIKFRGLTLSDIFNESNKLKFIITVNAEFIVLANKNPAFLHIINSNIATFDGMLPYILAKFTNPKKIFTKISGSDLIYRFSSYAESFGYGIFLLGGSEYSNKKSVSILRKNYPNAVFNGFSPTFSPLPFSSELNDDIINQISDKCPEILFVGFGALKQEMWINLNYEKLSQIGVKWVVGCGGTFDFVSGKVRRT